MLFGVDLLTWGSAVLNIGKRTLTYNGYEITMGMHDSDGRLQVARVTVSNRRIVPPNSVVQLKCKMDEDMPDYVIEPFENLKAFGPRVVRSAGATPYICVVNTLDRYLTLKRGQKIGQAYPVESFASDSYQTVSDADQTRVQQVRDETDDNTPLLPEHLRETFERSKGLLSGNQQMGSVQLLGSFEDVFGKNEFDLDTFTEIEHTIDTGKARPIKQRPRRTPAYFIGD